MIIARFLQSIFFLLLIIFLLAFAGTRMPNVGTDTPAYYNIFEMIYMSGSWFNVHYYEPLFVFINQLVVFWGGRAEHLIFVTVLITVIPTALLFKKISPSPSVSLVLYLCIFGYLMVFNGVRQAIAIAFFSWCVYFFFDKRFWWSISFAVIAACFHYTAIVALIMFLIFRKLSPVLIILLYLFSLIFVLSIDVSVLIYNFAFNFIVEYMPSKYASYIVGLGAAGEVGLKDFINQFIFLLAFYFYFFHKKYIDRKASFVLLCSMLSTILFNLFYYVDYLDRIASYFYFFNAVSIPLLITYIKGIYAKRLISFTVVLFSILLLTRSLVNGSNGIMPYSSWLL